MSVFDGLQKLEKKLDEATGNVIKKVSVFDDLNKTSTKKNLSVFDGLQKLESDIEDTTKKVAKTAVKGAAIAGTGVIKTLDIIDRPDRAARTVLRDLFDKGEFAPLKSAKEGLTGKGKDISSLISPEWRKEHPVKGVASDLGLTIFTSPTTYLTGFLGSLTKVGKLAKTGQLAKGYKAARQLEKIGKSGAKVSPKILKRLQKLSKYTKGTTKEQAKLGATIAERASKGQQSLAEFGIPFLKPTVKIRGQKVMETTRKLIDTVKGTKVGEILTTKFGVRPATMSDDAWNAFKRMKVDEATQEIRGLKGKDEQLSAMAEYIAEQDLSSDEIGAVIESIEKGTGKTIPRTEVLQLELQTILNKIKGEREALGLPVIEGHVQHITKKTKYKKMADYFKVWSKKNPADFHRNIRLLDEKTGTVIDLKSGELWKNGKKLKKEIDAPTLKLMLESENTTKPMTNIASIKEIEKAYGKKIFDDDAIRILDKSMSAHIKQKAGMQFYNKAKKAFGSPKKINATDVRIDDVWIPQPVAEELNRVAKVIDPGEYKQITKVYKDMIARWKALSTVYAPSFHSRNEAWNIMANAIGDVKDPRVYAKSFQILRKQLKGKKMTTAERQILEMYTKQGLDTVGWLSGDMAFKGKITQKAMNTSKALENNAKLAHFIDKMNKGYSPEAAAQSVRKYLFDYADLTPFERDTMKQAFPFYTFARKNLGLHASLMAESPQKLMNIERSLQAIERMNEGDRIPTKYLPEYLKESKPLLIGSDEKGRDYLSLGGWLATADIDDYTSLKGISRTAMNMLTPGVKVPLQLMGGYDFFKEKKYEELPEQELLQGYVDPKFKATILGLYRPLREADKLFGDKYADRKLGQIISNSLLGLRIDKYSDEQLAKSLKFMASEDRKELIKLRNKTAWKMIRLKQAGEEAKGVFESVRKKVGLGPEEAAKRKEEKLDEITDRLLEAVTEEADVLGKGMESIMR